MATRNVFVVGMNDFHRARLEALPHAEDCAFHGLLTPEDILDAETFPIGSMLERARQQLRAFEGTVDAVVGYMDFPVSTMLPILARERGLRTVSLESLLRCEHKYWSRLLQREVVSEHVPAFTAFDPFDPDPRARIDLEFPFWVKPIKSAGSWLGFRVEDQNDLDHAVGQIRDQVGRFADPFNDLLAHADLPPEVAAVDGHHCLAEALIGGWQCTLEGSVFEGDFDVHGVVDSVRVAGSTSFARYQYPSQLSAEVIDRMSAIARRVLEHVGYDDAAFNVEFFWDRDTDHVWLLEINTRVAQHHSALFELVDGVSNHQVMLDLHLGRRPHLRHGGGPHRLAAAFFVRRFEDAVVAAVPTEGDMAALAERFPGLAVELHVQPGTRLSEMTDQDSYSYDLAVLYLGAGDEEELLARHDACLAALPFELVPTDPDHAVGLT